MSQNKKKIREAFRQSCLKRDSNKCKMCGKINSGTHDVHHITDRSLMPSGGYVKENGITLCLSCHEKAEIFHSSGKMIAGWTPDDLYKVINGSYELALSASERLNRI